ncbi:tRNA synthetases class I-domain-containing protein [Haematococcus lacustris]
MKAAPTGCSVGVRRPPPMMMRHALCIGLPGFRLAWSRPISANTLAAAATEAATGEKPQGKPPGKKGGKRGKAKSDEGGEQGAPSPYSSTISLPVTPFSLRANSVVREPQIQALWEQQQVYEKLLDSNPGPAFTLHDGPPYANGDLHIGHALNKVLKDIINRYQLLRGRKARFVPGWDTHGLPIELKVLQSLPESERRSIGVTELRTKAREYALKAIDAQRNQFKRYGIWGDWSAPYITLQPGYEAAQLSVFGRMFLNGHIYRGRKPVHWSPSSRTALAEAELEYPEGHKSRSIYVAMPMEAVGPNVDPEDAEHLKGAAFAIWTTTPWTIPANLAVAVNGQLEYSLVAVQGEDAAGWSRKKLVVASDLVPKLQDKLGVQLLVLARLPGASLEGCTYRHPLFERVSPLVLGGDYITTDTGTGLVHTAPGHGQEDYQVGLRCGLPLLSPVDDAGCFTHEAGPRFAGKSVQGDGNAEVVTALAEVGALLLEEQYAHKYPYDWRTKKPTIFRATSQWFASVDGFKAQSLEAIRQVTWVPAAGQTRITSMTEGRNDWCISRQRKWGVPIPVFYDKQSDEPLMTEETISHVTQLVAQQGSDCWWTLPIEELLPPSLAHLAPSLRKGEDTMDVWFDSGSSWAGVLQTTPGLTFPADLYLEGSDQHRGWFQSSLLTSVAATGQAPYKQVLTHGFALDEKGAKMSKSLGNVVDPRIVIEGGKDERKDPPYGADVLRMWVASVDFTSDVMIGPGILKQVADLYRKMRGTLRFILGNLNDFDPQVHSVAYPQLPSLDRYMLHRLALLQAEATSAYDSYAFGRVSTALQYFVVKELSTFYLDIAKDRLYIQALDHPARRSCQTVLWSLLRGLLACLAPIAPHMADDAWQAAPQALQAGRLSVFQGGWAQSEPQWSEGLGADEARTWAALRTIRDAVNMTMEKARSAGSIGASLDARVLLHVADPGLTRALAALDATGNNVDELRTLFIVSQAELVADAATAKLASFTDVLPASAPSSSASPGSATGTSFAAAAAAEAGVPADVTIGVSKAEGAKCARCWNYSTQVGSVAPGVTDLCERCHPIMVQLGFSAQPNAAMSTGAAEKQAVVV